MHETVAGTRMPAFVLAALIGFYFYGCYESPKAYPYLLEEYEIIHGNLYTFDIDGNGDEEYTYIIPDEVLEGRDAIIANDTRGYSYDQINVRGKVSGNLMPVDVNGDGGEEVLVPVLVNDSVFIQVASFDPVKHEGHITFSQLLFTKPPSSNPEVDWDIRVVPLFKGTLGPGKKEEMVFIMNTGHGRMPRGIMITDFPNFAFRDSLYIGSVPKSDIGPRDYDGDGSVEYIMGSFAAGNGASAGGSVDTEAYLFGFSLSGLDIRWQTKVSDKRGQVAELLEGDFVGDERLEIAAYVRRKQNEPDLQIMDPVTGKSINRIVHSAAIEQAINVRPVAGGKDRILLIDRQDRLFLVSGNLEEMRQLDIPAVEGRKLYISQIEGVVHPGETNVVLTTRAETFLLNDKWKPIAKLPNAVIPGRQHTLRMGSTGTHLLHVQRGDESLLLRLQENPFYWLFRYWPVLIGIAILTAMGLPSVLMKRSAWVLKKNLTRLSERLAEREASICRLEKEASEREEALTKGKHYLHAQIIDYILPQKPDPFFVQLETVLKAHALDPDFSAGRFAERLGYSNRHLIRIAEDATGLKPMELIWRYRVTHAKHLLSEGKLTVTEIAYESGFKTPSYFSKKFQEIEGCLPSEFKD